MISKLKNKMEARMENLKEKISNTIEEVTGRIRKKQSTNLEKQLQKKSTIVGLLNDVRILNLQFTMVTRPSTSTRNIFLFPISLTAERNNETLQHCNCNFLPGYKRV